MSSDLRERARWLRQRHNVVNSLSEEWHWWRHRFGRRRGSCGRGVVVYQMGSVGSLSIVEALESLRLGAPVYHAHYLARDVLERPSRVLHHRLRWDLRSSDDRRRWSVVSAVRDPVAQDCASYVRNLAKPHYSAGGPDLVARYRSGAISMHDLVQNFLENVDHRRWLSWFDDEIGRLFGIDVYSLPFDDRLGYSILHGQRADLLVVRLEDMSRSLAGALGAFFGVDPPAMIPHANRNRRTFYQAFLAAARFPAWYLDLMYESRLARHFYPEEAIAAFRRCWEVPDAAEPRR